MKQPAERSAVSTLPSPAHARTLRYAAARLSAEFEGVMTRDELASVIEEEYARLAEAARVRDFLPIFAERAARERCLATARALGGRERVAAGA